MQINKIHFPITALGFGRRIGIWTQGCSLRCPGCCNMDTWQTDPAREIPVFRLLSELQAWLPQTDGLTVSGGEPFEQANELRDLVSGFKAIHSGDCLVFSGYSYDFLQRRFPWIVTEIDILITEPFDRGTEQTLGLRGSDNQRIFLHSELARKRYGEDVDQAPWPLTRQVDVLLEDGTLWIAGIPSKQLLSKIRRKLRQNGWISSHSGAVGVKA